MWNGSPPRVLFFMTHAGHARNFESTILELISRGCELHFALDREGKSRVEDIGDLLQGIADRHPGVTIHTAPQSGKTGSSEVARRIRAVRDYQRYWHEAYADAPKLRERAERKLPPGVRGTRAAEALAHPFLRAGVGRLADLIDRATPIRRSVRDFVTGIDPDIVLVTPLVELGSPQVEYVRCAKALGVPVGLLVASWDNLTMKGCLHEPPDFMCVWNQSQVVEAEQLHGFPAARTAVTGAVAYDHWFNWTPSRTREEFCRQIGLDPARPFVAYVASSGFIAPGEGEFVKAWRTAMRSEPLLEGVQVLARPHPTRPLQSKKGALNLGDPDLVVYPPAGRNPTSQEARDDYFDSLSYCAAVVGINTSAFIESAILERPVHTVLTPRYRDTQRGTLHFRHLIPENGGPLFVATSYAEHFACLAATIADPSEAVRRDREFVGSFVRPNGADRPAARLAVDAIEKFTQLGPQEAQSPSIATRGLGRALALPVRMALRHRVGTARRKKLLADAIAEFSEPGAR